MLVLFETRSYLKFILLYSEAYTVYVHYIDEEFLNLNSYKSPYVKKEQFYSTFLSVLFYCNFNQFYLIAKMPVENQTWFCWGKSLYWKNTKWIFIFIIVKSYKSGQEWIGKNLFLLSTCKTECGLFPVFYCYL